MAPAFNTVTGESFENLPAALTRMERVEWSADYGRISRRTLGDLRRLLRELAEWPDDAYIECAGISAFRALPLHTEAET